MRHTVTFLLLLIGFAYSPAEPAYETGNPSQQIFQSQQMLNSGSSYSGTTYVPFDNTVPSESSGSNHAPGKGHVRKSGNDNWDSSGFITGPEINRGQEYPLGEPWVLAVLAGAFAVTTACCRKRKSGAH